MQREKIRFLFNEKRLWHYLCQNLKCVKRSKEDKVNTTRLLLIY